MSDEYTKEYDTPSGKKLTLKTRVTARDRNRMRDSFFKGLRS
jgi:hypothetical protein